MDRRKDIDVEITCFDDEGNEVDVDKAKKAMIREYKNGIFISETIGKIEND